MSGFALPSSSLWTVPPGNGLPSRVTVTPAAGWKRTFDPSG
jgi:hypothetical protein